MINELYSVMFIYRLLQVTSDAFVLFILLPLLQPTYSTSIASANLFVEVNETRFDSSAQQVCESVFLQSFSLSPAQTLSRTQENLKALLEPLFFPLNRLCVLRLK